MDDKSGPRHDRRTFLTWAGGVAATAAGLGGGTDRAFAQTTRKENGGVNDLCFTSARELATLIRTRKVSAREVMSAYLQRISRLNQLFDARSRIGRIGSNGLDLMARRLGDALQFGVSGRAFRCDYS